MLDRAKELRKDFERLGDFLHTGPLEAKDAANLARERRITSAELERLEKTEGGTLVDELAAKRTRSGAHRPPARRRKSG